MKKGNKKLKLSVFEIVWYTICLLVALWGITYIVLGLLGQYLPMKASDNPIRNASNSYASVFGMGFFGYGLIHTGVACVAALIVLLMQSKKADRDVEKAQRRAAIRASINKQMEENEEEIIDVSEQEPAQVPVQEEPVQEEKPVQEAAPEMEEAPAEEPKEEVAPETNEEPKEAPQEEVTQKVE